MRKRRKCWLPAFSPLPKSFWKGSFLGVVKFWDDSVVKSELMAICERHYCWIMFVYQAQDVTARQQKVKRETPGLST